MTYLDYIFFCLVSIYLILDLLSFGHLLVDQLVDQISPLVVSSGDSILQMSNSNPGSGFTGNQGLPGNSGSPNNMGGNPGGGFPQGPITTHNTNTQIIHDDGTWSNTIKSLFVYGTGGLRYWANMSRGGTPSQKLFIIGTTVGGDLLSRAIQNTINDPAYVKNQINNWKLIWKDATSADVHVDSGTEQVFKDAATSVTPSISDTGVGTAGGSGAATGSGSLSGTGVSSGGGIDGTGEIAKNMLGNFDIDLWKISETIISRIAAYLEYIFEPTASSFSNEVLSNQIHDISILLFLTTLCIVIVFFSLLVNLVLYMFSDRLMCYFNNWYIKWYLTFNKKVITLEIIMLSGWIFYLLYMILFGLHYIATHPILF